MPTINFTNATGTFTYEETTAPPPGGGGGTPPSGEIAIPEGRITNFSNKNETTFNIAGKPYWLETPGKSWNISQVDDRTLRFEIRKGDQFTSSYWNDPVGKERCEISTKEGGTLVPPTGTALLQHRMMWESGPINKAAWIVFSQFHELDVGNSPPYAIELDTSDKMKIDIGMNAPQIVYQDPKPIERGKWYTIQTEAKWDRTNGFLRVKRDGIQIVDYSGPFGTGVAHYLKFGIYRNTTPEIAAVQYRDVTISVS